MKRGFTLIELLVVIAIIAILAAILFPVFAQAKVAAKKTTAISNQKQIALAFMMYTADHDDRLPNMTWADSYSNNPSWGSESELDPGWYWNGSLAWAVSLVPYHRNSTEGGNRSSFLISPNDPAVPNFTKPTFKEMLMSVGWTNAENWSTDWRINAEIFPLSFCANYGLSYTSSATDPNDGRTWGLRSWTGPRALTTIAAPANQILVTEYGQGIADSYQANSYSNYYCQLGYGGVDRWREGRRYGNGRTFSFTDGHVKFLNDPVKIEELNPANGNLQMQVREAYAGANIFDMPDRDRR